MKFKAIINAEYTELCKEYGHLAYHKKLLEDKMLAIEKKINGLNHLSEKFQSVEKVENNERSNKDTPNS